MGTSSVESLTTRLPLHEEREIKAEPMLWDCDLKHAEKLGSTITRAFIARLPQDWVENPALTIDSWVTRVKAGWYPCKPGWQFAGRPGDRFMAATANGTAAHVEFAVGKYPSPVDNPTPDDIDVVVDELVLRKKLQLWIPRADRFMTFTGESIYRCLPADATGWQWAGRVTIRGYKHIPTNERIRQTQVYIK